MKLIVIISSAVALTFGVTYFYFVNQKTDMWRLDLATKTIEAHERSLEKLSGILVDTNALRYDAVIEFASTHEAEYWTDSDGEFKYIYLEYLILTFDANGSLVSIRTNSL